MIGEFFNWPPIVCPGEEWCVWRIDDGILHFSGIGFTDLNENVHIRCSGGGIELYEDFLKIIAHVDESQMPTIETGAGSNRTQFDIVVGILEFKVRVGISEARSKVGLSGRRLDN